MEKDEAQQITARWETATRYYIAVLQVDLLGDWTGVFALPGACALVEPGWKCES